MSNSVHLTARIDSSLMEELDLLAASSGVVRNEIVKKALRFYIDAGGPSNEFAERLLKTIGFRSLDELLMIIDGQIDARLGQAQEITTSGTFDELTKVTLSPVEKEEPAEKEDRLPRVLSALDSIISILENGKAVVVSDIATKFGLDPSYLSIKLGVKTVRKSMNGKKERFYTVDKLPELIKVRSVLVEV